MKVDVQYQQQYGVQDSSHIQQFQFTHSCVEQSQKKIWSIVHPSCDEFPLYDEVQSFEIHMMDRYTFIHIIQCTIRGKSASKGK